MLSKKLVKSDCIEIYKKKKNLKDFFQAQASHIYLTMDIWISNQELGYLFITAHGCQLKVA